MTIRLLTPAALAMLLLGCAPAPPPASSPSQPDVPPGSTAPATQATQAGENAAALDANQILERLLAKYRSARTYQDEGVVRLAFRQQSQPVSQQWPVQLSFERPNKLALVAYQAAVKCDGNRLRAIIEDPASGNLDGQVLDRPAPDELQLTDLASDPLLYDILASRLRRQPIQLELILESSGLVSAFQGDIACRKLDDATHQGRTCFRIEVPSPGGSFVFWVDQTDFLLRRLDYPATALVPELANDPSTSDLQLVADLRGARIDAPLPADTFTMQLPAGARLMKTFVVPPQPLPTDLLGKQPEPFFFTDLRGKRISGDDLQGKVAILAWYHDNPACEATLQQVALAADQLKDDASVTFFAIATDPTSTSNQQVAQRLAEWQVNVPVVRDLEAFGDKVFSIKLHPTIVVLDDKGRVQIFQAGGNPELAGQIATIVERLKAGDDLAADIVTAASRQRQQYEALVARGGPEPGEVLELPEAVIRRRSEPARLRLSKLWSCTDIKMPGNIVAAETNGEATRLYVFEGWRAVAEVNEAGQVTARHALDLPDQAAVTFARTAIDSGGRRLFIVGAPLGAQAFLFDAKWQRIQLVPKDDETPLSIVDVALADLGNEDGKVDIVAASVADLGLVAMSQEGDILWRNRAFKNAVSIAIAPPDDLGQWALFLAGETGEVLRVNRFGHEEKPIKVANWPILRLTGGRFTQPTQATLLGLSHDARQEVFAVGLSRDIQECWNYPLPAGVHQRPIEPVTSSELLEGHQGEWWLAGPDGSIHVISEDGEFFDSFFYGATLTGLAATRLGGKPVLLVATDAGLDAWAIEGIASSTDSASQPPRRAVNASDQSPPDNAPPSAASPRER